MTTPNNKVAHKASFSQAELERYNRHIIIPEFGIEAQSKLKNARVLVIGAGGLGSPVLLYLAAAGVGKIGIIDFDKVDDSNLQRQILYGIENIGQAKVDGAKAKLLQLNPHITIETYCEKLTSQNAVELFKNYDVVADGSDNFQTRYLVNDACVICNIPLVFASILQFEGQVSVFNLKDKDGFTGPNYRDLFPTPPNAGSIPSCGEGGVLGVLPGIIGTLQANEVIKVITGVGEPLSGKLYSFDALTMSNQIFKIQKNPDAPAITELTDYDLFCGITAPNSKEITVEELLDWRRNNYDFQLIDVREVDEYEEIHINGENMPLSKLRHYVNSIMRDKKVVVHCKLGGRSRSAIEQLEKQYGFTNLVNLKGGIEAFSVAQHREFTTN